ncbi:MAG: metallophosphoesterase family protein, partial [Deltaproteobacteria bacterium]|nr:metallophosphoesterase family protein [Deltaproteobacteria bacterium]
MPRLLLLVVLAIVLWSSRAHASNYPYVQDGPVITGVSPTEAWVTWYTAHHEGQGTECTIEENTPGLGDHNTDTPTLSLSTGALVTDTNCDRTHRVHLTGLSPSTAYTFTLDKEWDAKGGTIAAGSFTTAPAAGSGAGVKFVVYGDTRNDLALGGTDTSPHHQAVVDAIIAHESDAAFIVHTGDLALNIVGVSGDDRGYTEFFSIERPLLAHKPLFVVLGNHETIDTTFFDTMFDPARFSGSAHPYYQSFDWGKVHFALADSFEGSPTTLGLGGLNPGVTDAQVQWLDADLQNAHAHGQVSFLGIHQGPYSHSSDSKAHGGLADVVLKIIPLMLKYGVRASLAGHDHYYQRGHEGCIDYLVLGGGGAPMYAPDTGTGIAIATQTISYMVVT